ncbi:MAG: hypothetical protein WDZ69_02070 [Candidatus Pacearchaeota archaeon]
MTFNYNPSVKDCVDHMNKRPEERMEETFGYWATAENLSEIDEYRAKMESEDGPNSESLESIFSHE